MHKCMHVVMYMLVAALCCIIISISCRVVQLLMLLLNLNFLQTQQTPHSPPTVTFEIPLFLPLQIHF